MTAHYDTRAVSIVEGHGLLIPDDRRKIDTSLMAFSAGYSLFVGAVYRLFGRNFFAAQLVQELLCSLCPVLLFLIAGELISWRLGIAAGLLAAFYHGIAFFSNFILPDPLCPLPILFATYLLVMAWVKRNSSYMPFLAAGLALGLSVWLRPNALLLGPFSIAILVLCYKRWRSILPRAVAMVAVTFLVVSPITIRNYIMFDRFVPVWIGLGTVLWQGIGESSGGQFGAPQSDEELGLQEVVIYGDPHYTWWATPDGPERDRARIKKSLDVIVHNPVWFSGVMIRRMWAMTQCSEWAPLVDVHLGEGVAVSASETVPSKVALAPGVALSQLRQPVKRLERLAKETTPAFAILGGIITCFISRRRWLFIFTVPAYYLIFQSPMHTEFRYILPMHYFLAIFAGVIWCLIIHSAKSWVIRSIQVSARVFWPGP
jgi:4-amino-4-deoxy-L-arabinose transferase-like glycosyltransferase